MRILQARRGLLLLLGDPEQLTLPRGGDGLAPCRSDILEVLLRVAGEAQIVCNEVEIAASITPDDHHSFLVSVLAERLGNSLVADGARELNVLLCRKLNDFLGGGDSESLLR